MKVLRWDAASSLGRPENCSFLTRFSKAASISYDFALVAKAIGVLIKSLLLVFEKSQSLVFSFMVTSASKHTSKQRAGKKKGERKGKRKRQIGEVGERKTRGNWQNKVNARDEFATHTWMSS